MHITNILEKRKHSNAPALKYGNLVLTYSALHVSVQNTKKFLEEHIKEKRLNVGIFIYNSPEYVTAYFAIAYSDHIIVPLNPASKGREILSEINYCDVSVILTTSQGSQKLASLFNNNSYKGIVIDIEKMLISYYGSPSIPHKVSVAPRDVALMLHTSGTTSRPKRVMLTHENLLSNVKATVDSLRLTSDDRTLIVLPIFFGYCNTAQLLTHLSLGATVTIMGGIFTPSKLLGLVSKERITNFNIVPTHLILLKDHPKIDSYDLSSLRYVCFGGGKMPVPALEQIISKFRSVGIVQTYGLTEASPRVTMLSPKYAISKAGSVGKPLPGVVVRIYKDGKESEVFDEVGEIVVQSKGVMKGYYKRGQETHQALRKDGLWTGDLGYFDRDGFLYLSGRRKNIIITGGVNVYPEEIESLLQSIDDVSDARVYGVDHDILGEAPAAYVVKALGSQITKESILSFCKERLSDYKIPRNIAFVEEIPKTYNGKIKRH